MKLIYLSFLFFIVSCFSIQSQEIERLKKELTTIKTDTTKVWHYRDLAYYYQSKNLDSAIYFGYEGYYLAKAINFKSGQIGSLYQVALAYDFKDKLDSAIVIYDKAIEIAKSSRDTTNLAKLLNAKGTSHYFSGNYLEALTYFNNGLDYSERINYQEGFAHSLNNIAVIYRMQRRYEMALEVYEKSLDIKIKQKDTTGIINSYYNMGLSYSHLNQYSESLQYLLKAKNLSEYHSDSKLAIANIDVGIGIAYYNLENFSEAIDYLNKGFQSTEGESYDKIIAKAYLGAIYVKNGNIAEGLIYIEEAYNQSVLSGRRDLHRSVLRERAIAYEKANNNSKASESWKAYAIISDSINYEARQWAIEELQARFELKDKETTISLQQLKLEKETNQKRWYLIFGIFIAVALVIISLFLQKILIQRKQLFFQISEKVEALNLNKLLLREMHHRTKNNLQLINSILNLQSRNVDNPEVQKSLESSRDSVSAIGLLHNQLYNSREFNLVDFKAYVNDLCAYFTKAFSLQERNISLACSCDDFKIDIDKAIPLGLILNETITNAIKHAFVDSKQGDIHLTIKNQNQNISLEVQDNGIGFNTNSLPSGNKGTGTKLIAIFSKKFKAEVSYLNTKPGTLFKFCFQL